MTVAVLCAGPRSHYLTMQDVEVWDARRDVRKFEGGMPIVAHPPCRAWSAFCGHQSHPAPGERELGPLCVAWLRRCGGVLEHPAHSRLWAECGLPLPGRGGDEEYAVQVNQSWWGFPTAKRTWLCFFGVPRREVEWPALRWEEQRIGDRRAWQVMSKAQRSRTMPELARWLVGVARISRPLAGQNAPGPGLEGRNEP